MKTNIAKLRATAEKALVTQLNGSGVKTEGIIIIAGLTAFVLGLDRPHDVGLRAHLATKGVDTKKMAQNAFQIAVAATLIGEHGETQPKAKAAPKVSEDAFIVGGTRTLMAVSTCLNTLEKAVKDGKMPSGEAPGHHVKLCGFIVEKDAKGAKAYADTLRAEFGKPKKPGDGEAEDGAEELIGEITDAEELLSAMAAVTLRVSKVAWTPELTVKARMLIAGMASELNTATLPKAPAIAIAA